MPKSECRKKSEVRSSKRLPCGMRITIGLGRLQENHLRRKPALGISDFGLHSDFSIRSSELLQVLRSLAYNVEDRKVIPAITFHAFACACPPAPSALAS